MWRRQERGQVIVLAAGAMVVVLGFAALAIDIGFFAHTKRDLQNDADAMALAGAQEIPDQGLANSKALQWGTNNGVDLGSEVLSIEFGTTCSGSTEPNTITVRLERSQPTFLARALGITSGTLHACATAGRFSVDRFIGAAPWGIEDNCIWGADGQRGGEDDITLGETITLKYDADNSGGECDAHTGNFGALAIDLTGATPCGDEPGDSTPRKYGDAICWGAITPLHTYEGSTPATSASCALDPGGCVRTETGNIIGPTKKSVDYLFDHVSTQCDTWDEIVDQDNDTLRATCNPLSKAYVGGPSIVKLIPVLDGLWGATGSSDIPIVDFVFVVLEKPASSNWCTGSQCDITARFVERATVPAGTKGPLDPKSLITTVALVE
jgi:hypothetical protein